MNLAGSGDDWRVWTCVNGGTNKYFLSASGSESACGDPSNIEFAAQDKDEQCRPQRQDIRFNPHREPFGHAPYNKT